MILDREQDIVVSLSDPDQAVDQVEHVAADTSAVMRGLGGSNVDPDPHPSNSSIPVAPVPVLATSQCFSEAVG